MSKHEKTAPSELLYSILDLAPIVRQGTAAESFRNSLDLARHAESFGYHRYWVAEHHNIAGIACAATSVLMAYLAGGTSKIRIGSGGIMLPNHAPLVIAEQFGTLESLYPGRIDLGLGRAPGGDRATIRALRRSVEGADSFPQDVLELQGYLKEPSENQSVHAIPGQGLNVPLYLLGSSTFSAQLAARMGLPFAFASHFAPDQLHAALDIYRRRFRPSEDLNRPHVMVGVNVFAADNADDAALLFNGLRRQFLNLIRGLRRPLAPPEAELDWSPMEAAQVERMIRYAAVGDSAALRDRLEAILKETGADEIIATAQIFDHRARLRSFEIAAEAF